MRAGHAAENVVVLRHIAANPLQQERSRNGRSMKGKRLEAEWDNDYLLTILAAIYTNFHGMLSVCQDQTACKGR